MNFLTSLRIFCLYPALISHNITAGTFPFESDEILDLMDDTITYQLGDRKFDTCGMICPMIYRFTQGLPQFGQYIWGASRYNVLQYGQ